MVSRIPPSNREWFHAVVLQPYKEGAERINRAFAGVDFLTLELRPLFLKERIVSLIAGVLLMTPLANSILWIAMQIFGQPVFLTDPCLAEERPAQAAETGPAAAEIPLPSAKSPSQPEEAAAGPPITPPLLAPSLPPPQTTRFVFLEKHGHFEEECFWKIEEFPDLVLATKQSETELATSRYNLNGLIQEYHFRFQDDSGEMHVQMDGRTLRVIGKKGSEAHERVHAMKGNIPWIQQLTLGLKEFLFSPNQKLEFYIIYPKDLSLHKLIAEKKRIEQVPGFGNLQKIDVHSESLIYNLLGMGGKLWFDPQSGEMKKMIVHADPRDYPLIAEWRRNGL